MRRAWVLFCAVVLALCVGRQAAGATRVGIGAFGGGVIPSGSLFSEATSDGYMRFEQDPGAVGGGRLTFLTGTRLGIEFEGVIGGPPVAYYAQIGSNGEPAQIEARRAARIGFASLALLYTFYRPPLAPHTLYFLAGPGVTAHGGAFFDHPSLRDEQLAPGFVAGLGLRYGFAQGMHVRLEVRDHASLYRAARRFDQRWQHDLVPSLGLDWVVIR